LQPRKEHVNWWLLHRSSVNQDGIEVEENLGGTREATKKMLGHRQEAEEDGRGEEVQADDGGGDEIQACCACFGVCERPTTTSTFASGGKPSASAPTKTTKSSMNERSWAVSKKSEEVSAMESSVLASVLLQ
jgi:hypothetical protein